MNIARDHTGAVVGQVTRLHAMTDAQLRQAWTDAPEAFYETSRGSRLTLLTRDGRYVTVPASSVRLEELR